MSRADFEEGRNRAKNEIKDREETDKSALEVGDQIYGGISQMVSSLQQMGVEIPEGLQNVIGALGGVMGLLQGITILVEGIQSLETVGTFLGIFGNGGIIGKAAGGMFIPGNSYSGDNLRMPVVGGGMIGVNSGEVILNQAQAGNLASQLQGNSGHMQLETTITGEQIRLVLNNNSRRRGKGEYVTSNRR